MKKFILALFLILPSVCWLYNGNDAENETMNLFFKYYRGQNVGHFIKVVKNVNPDNMHDAKTIEVFVSQSLSRYRGYIDDFCEVLPEIDQEIRPILIRALWVADKENPKFNEFCTPEIQRSIDYDPPMTIDEWVKFKITQADEIDFMWASFFASGERKYLIKIVDATYENTEALIIAKEWRNKQNDEDFVMTMLEFGESAPDEFFDQVMISFVGINSLYSAADRDPVVKMIFEEAKSKYLDPDV